MGGMIGNLFGGSAPTQPNAQIYQPAGTAQQDTNLQGLLNNNNAALTGGNNPYSQLSPQFMQAFQQLFSPSTTAGYNTSAGNAGTAYGNVGTNSLNSSTALSGALAPALSNAGTVMNTAFDPQNALYAQQLQKTTDTANVNNAAYGLTGQQAAANTNTADTNFNIDWQDNELQRQLSGLAGYDQTVTNVGTAGNDAAVIGNSGANSTLNAGQVPYAASSAIGGQQENALSQYITQLLGPTTSTQSAITNESNYLGQGIGASTSQASQALEDYQQQSQNTGGLFGALGDILGFSPGGGGTSTLGGSLLNSGGDMMSSLMSLFSNPAMAGIS